MEDDNENNFMNKANYDQILDRKGKQIRSLFTDYISFDRFEIIASPKLFGFRQVWTITFFWLSMCDIKSLFYFSFVTLYSFEQLS